MTRLDKRNNVAVLDYAFLIMFALKLLALVTITWWVVFLPLLIKLFLVTLILALEESTHETE
jgi:hypothetical protein